MIRDTLSCQVYGQTRSACRADGLAKLAAVLEFDPEDPPAGMRVEVSLDLHSIDLMGGDIAGWLGEATATVYDHRGEPEF